MHPIPRSAVSLITLSASRFKFLSHWWQGLFQAIFVFMHNLSRFDCEKRFFLFTSKMVSSTCFSHLVFILLNNPLKQIGLLTNNDTYKHNYILLSISAKTKLLVEDLPVQIEARRLEWIKSCLPWR